MHANGQRPRRATQKIHKSPFNASTTGPESADDYGLSDYSHRPCGLSCISTGAADIRRRGEKNYRRNEKRRAQRAKKTSACAVSALLRTRNSQGCLTSGFWIPLPYGWACKRRTDYWLPRVLHRFVKSDACSRTPQRFIGRPFPTSYTECTTPSGRRQGGCRGNRAAHARPFGTTRAVV